MRGRGHGTGAGAGGAQRDARRGEPPAPSAARAAPERSRAGVGGGGVDAARRGRGVGGVRGGEVAGRHAQSTARVDGPALPGQARARSPQRARALCARRCACAVSWAACANHLTRPLAPTFALSAACLPVSLSPRCNATATRVCPAARGGDVAAPLRGRARAALRGRESGLRRRRAAGAAAGREGQLRRAARAAARAARGAAARLVAPSQGGAAAGARRGRGLGRRGARRARGGSAGVHRQRLPGASRTPPPSRPCCACPSCDPCRSAPLPHTAGTHISAAAVARSRGSGAVPSRLCLL